MTDEMEVFVFSSSKTPIGLEKREQIARLYGGLLNALTDIEASLPHKVAFLLDDKVICWQAKVTTKKEFLRTNNLKDESEQPPKYQQQIPRWRLWDFAKKRKADDNRRT